MIRDLPTDLNAAADFHRAYMGWPTTPFVHEAAELCSYAEQAMSKAEDAIRARDKRIEELEAQLEAEQALAGLEP